VADEHESRIDDLRIFLDLPCLGELIAAVALRLTQLRGIEPPDYEGQEMRDLAITGYLQVEFMADREKFKSSILSDLDNLDKPEPETIEAAPVQAPNHQAEFGL
jgi:hypothetical protein